MIRKFLFWIHLTSGIVAAIPLVVMAVTGILLSFEPQILDHAEKGLRRVEVGQGARASLDAVAQSARRLHSGKITAIVVSLDPSDAVQVRFGRESTVWVNPWTGYALGESSFIHQGFAKVEGLHRWLGTRDKGLKVAGTAALLCLLLSLTGFVLWWPRSAKALARVLWPRRGLKGRARAWQWHNSVGVVVLPFLLALSLTGTVMAWPWAEIMVYLVAGSEPPRRVVQRALPPDVAKPRIDSMLSGEQSHPWQTWMDTARTRAPSGWQAFNLRAPTQPGKGAEIQIHESPASRDGGVTVVLRPDGSCEQVKPLRTDPGSRAFALVRPLHTGQLFGWIGQLAMALAATGVLVLVWTGLSQALRRLFRKRDPDEDVAHEGEA